MPDRSAPIVVTPRACPFVALDGDRDRRLDAPDPLHRCFAEQVPRARSISHQAEFCLSPTFAGCPIFQDWATRAAAEPVVPKVSVGSVAQGTTDRQVDGVTGSAPATPGVMTSAGLTLDDDLDPVMPARPSRALDAQAADEELLATRSVPAYRAVSPTGAASPTAAVPTGAVPTARTTRVDREGPVAGGGLDAFDPVDDIPVIRSMPPARSMPAALPPAEEDWAAPPPWLRPPTGPVWIAEAVPPPDALADIGTQPVRRPRSPDASSAALAEATAAASGEPVIGVSGSFGEETTGMPLELPPIAPAPPSDRASADTPGGSEVRIIEATGTGTQPVDPGVSAELAASRYRADVMAGLAVDEEVDAGVESRPASRGRRVPIDVQAAASLGSQSQARPSVRSTGSREWEGPRRFEAYAATQRRRPPTSLLVGGSAIALAVLLLGVFLLPGLLMGGAPAMTAAPGSTAQTAAVVATEAPPGATVDPERTTKPDTTPKPRTYTVKSGDTLIKIAKRFKVTVPRITCLNKIKNPNNVAVGRTLTIPPKGYRCPRD